MKTSDFRKQLTSAQLKENMSKMFGMQVPLEKYSREQLEDMRNKLRTRMFQHEGRAGINDLLTNETYQKDKAMLALLNTRIKEMLGEDIKKLKDKMVELSEAKKGVRAPKHTKKAKGTDKDGDGKPGEFDDVQVARMTAGGVPKKKAIAKATSDKFNESNVEEAWPGTPGGYQPGQDSNSDQEYTARTGHKVKRKPGVVTATKVAPKEKDQQPKKESKVKEAAKSCNHTAEGKMCPVHKMAECPMEEGMKMVKSPKGKKSEMVPAFAADGKGKKDLKKTDESIINFRRNVKLVNESLAYLLQEDEEEKAKAITAASDMANDFTSWMQRVGQYQTKVMIELSDEIRHNFGAAEAEAFKQAVGPALSSALEVLTQQREAISNAIATLAGEQVAPTEPMGAEPAPEPEMPMEPTAPDEMNTPPADEFGASDAAAGAGTPGREMRESKFARRLAESHSIISRLAK